jgi:hypothetical protein
MKILFGYIWLLLAISYVKAACDMVVIRIVVEEIITGPPDLVLAILTPEDQRTDYMKELIIKKVADIKANVTNHLNFSNILFNI